MTRVPPKKARTSRILGAAVPRRLQLALLAASLAACSGKTAQDYLEAAKADLAKNDRPAAIIQLKNALQEQPSLAEARFLLGKSLLQAGNPRDAAIELGKAQDAGYPVEQLTPLIAEAMVAQGQFQQVVTNYHGTRLGSPKETASLQVNLAIAYGELGQMKEAMELIKAAIAADDASVRARIIQVRLHARQGETDEALKLVEALVAKLPKDSEVWEVKGDVLLRSGKPKEALGAYREAVVLNKNNVPAQIGVMTLLLAQKDLDGAAAQLAVLKGMKVAQSQVLMLGAALALEKNDLKLAREQVQLLLKYAPEDPRVLQLAGAIEFRRGALLEADSFLSKAIQAEPDVVKTRILLVQTKLRQADYAKALTLLQPLLAAQNPGPEAYGLAAEAYLQMGDVKRAEEYFSKVAQVSPGDVRSRVALALSTISKGRLDEGVAALRAVAAADPSPLADLSLVTTFLQRGAWDEVLKALDGLAAKTPGQPMAATLRGGVEQVRGNTAQARSAFEAALKIDPVYLPATNGLAEMDLAEQHPDAAKARFKKILEVQPNNLQANMALVALSAKAGASKDELKASLEKLAKQLPTELQPRVALVELLIQRKDFKAAKSVAQEAVADLPDSPDAWRVLAQTQGLSGDGNQALASLNKWAALAPASPEPQMALASLYAKQGNTSAQMQSIKRSLSLKPDFQPAQLALFGNELAAGHFAEARRVAETIQSQRPAEALGKALMGDVSVMQKNWADAAANYRAALKLQALPELAGKLHRALVAGGKTAEARDLESEWTNAHPRDITFLDYLANDALARKDLDQAEQRYLAILKVQPDNAAVANNLAWLLNKTKKPGALAYAEKANRIEPNQPALMDTLAEIYGDAGQLDKALDVQKRIVALVPDLPGYRLHLARLYVAAGQKTEARTELTRLQALGDKFIDQAEVTKLMARL